MDAALTLEKAKTLVQQHEAVHKQQILLKHGQKDDKSIDFLQQGVPFKRKVPPRNHSQAPARKPRQVQSKCSHVAEGHTHDNSAQPEILSTTTAKRKKHYIQCTMFSQGGCRGHHTSRVECDRLLRCSLPQPCECRANHNMELYCPTR